MTLATRGMQVMELLFLIPIVLVQGILIWVSLKAKPLGSKPYRWATYVGITTGLVALSFFFFSLSAFKSGNLSGVATLGILTAFGALASVGILRRKKFGVVFFVLIYSGAILIPPFLDAIRNQPPSTKPGQNFPILIFLILTAVYFKRRWKLLGNPPGNSLSS